MKLERKFYKRDTLIVARELLGKYLVRKQLAEEKKLKIQIGIIVEVEAYIGEEDLACHASKGRTKRTEIMYGEAGHAYVYMVYGMYHCLNLVTEKEGFPAAVLIRAVEPILRSSSFEGQANCICENTLDFRKIANGPGKLCRWMEIDRGLNGEDITKSEELYITDKIPENVILTTSMKCRRPESKEEESDSGQARMTNSETFEVFEAKRIGIDYAKHCADHRWRFYIKDNPFISRK